MTLNDIVTLKISPVHYVISQDIFGEYQNYITISFITVLSILIILALTATLIKVGAG